MRGTLLRYRGYWYVGTPEGLLGKEGGFTNRFSKAQRFGGPGEAIRIAQIAKVAIVNDVRP